MMKRLRYFSFLLLIGLAAGLRAQVFMRPFDNAVAMGMGGATVALPDFRSGMTNEGQLGIAPRVGVWAGTAAPYGLTDWQTAVIQGVVGIGKNSGAGIAVDHSATEGYAEQRFRFSYGRRLAKAIYLGASADVLRVSADEYGNATLGTFSLGVLAQALPTVWIGARLQNPFQQQLGEDVAPSVFRAGAVWKPTDIFMMAFETEKDLERRGSIKVGLEYRPLPVLALRTGIRSNRVARLSFGAGLRLRQKLFIDLASEWHPSLGLTPSILLAWVQGR